MNMPAATCAGAAVAVLLLLSLALPAQAAVAAFSDNCQVLTQPEVEAFYQAPVTSFGEQFTGGCGWVPQGKTMAYLTVRIGEKQSTASAVFAQRAEHLTIQEVAGLGDDAAVLLRGQIVLDLLAQKGQRQVRFNCPFLKIEKDSPGFDRLKVLMRQALERL
jgi:hypothetical protein